MTEYLRDEEAWSVTPYEGMMECPICGNHFQPCTITQDVCDECDSRDDLLGYGPHEYSSEDG